MSVLEFKPKAYADMFRRMRHGKIQLRSIARAIDQGREVSLHRSRRGTAVPDTGLTTPTQSSMHQNFTMDDAPRKRWVARAGFAVRHHS